MSCWNEPNNKNAFVLSWVSTFVTIVFAIIGIVYYMATGSTMCLVFGLENVVDFLSSVVVLWRFWASGKMTKEREKTLKRRELRASMAISFIMMILGMGIISTSSHDIAVGPDGNSHDLDIVLVMAGMSVFVFGCLSVFKFQYANALVSDALYKDGVCSLIGAILGAALFTNTLIIRGKPQIWWLDPAVAMICGFVALWFGCHSIFVAWKLRRVPILSLSWWLMSRGNGKYGTRPPRESSEDDEIDDGQDQGDKTDTENEVEMKGTSTNLSNEIV